MENEIIKKLENRIIIQEKIIKNLEKIIELKDKIINCCKVCQRKQR